MIEYGSEARHLDPFGAKFKITQGLSEGLENQRLYRTSRSRHFSYISIHPK